MGECHDQDTRMIAISRTSIARFIFPAITILLVSVTSAIDISTSSLSQQSKPLSWIRTTASSTLSLVERSGSAALSRQNVFRESVRAAPAKGYVIPFLTGQGVNNQIWEYRASMAIAKDANRKLCLVPFQRFYLSEGNVQKIPSLRVAGVTKFALPFNLLFGARFIGNLSLQTATVKECSSACRRRPSCTLHFTSHDIHRVADWRPGSIHRFTATTGISRLKVSHTRAARPGRNVLAQCRPDDCAILVAAKHPTAQDDIEITNALGPSRSIQELAKWVKRNILRLEDEDSFACIHWRLEETKCRGLGIGLSDGRSAFNGEREAHMGSPLCFPSVPDHNLSELRSTGSKRVLGIVAHLVDALRVFSDRVHARGILLATDCHDVGLLGLVEREGGVIALSSALKRLIASPPELADDEVRSRVEQTLCSAANGFLGSTYSSWSETVFRWRNAASGRDGYQRGSFTDNTMEGALEVEMLRAIKRNSAHEG